MMLTDGIQHAFVAPSLQLLLQYLLQCVVNTGSLLLPAP